MKAGKTENLVELADDTISPISPPDVPAIKADTQKSAQDFLIGLVGFVTSVLTAVVLWLLEERLGFAFYSWTFWLVIPVGAILSGFAGASGYLAGAWFLGHRPSRLMLLNIVLASLTTFFLVHHLPYRNLEIESSRVSDYISFLTYLDTVITTTSMEFSVKAARIGETGELGAFGYVVALMQICGFALGGLAVYGHLSSLPYCENCSRYLSVKDKLSRYTADVDALQGHLTTTMEQLRAGNISAAAREHSNFGTAKPAKESYLQSILHVRNCSGCGQRWAKVSVEKLDGNEWKEIPDLTSEGFVSSNL